MPTLRRTPFNLGGSYVADPFDQAEQSNRNAALQQAQLMDSRQANDRYAQIALAKLNADNYQFGQKRADDMAMYREKLAHDDMRDEREYGYKDKLLAADNDRFGKQFDYMSGRDARLDRQHHDEWEFEHDKEKNPALAAQFMTLAAQQRIADEMERQRKREEEKQKRSDEAGGSAPDMTGWTPEDIAEYKARLSVEGTSPAMAGLGVRDARRQRANDELTVEEQALGNDLRTFSEKDNKVFGFDPTDEDTQGLAARLAKLEEALRVKLNLGQAAAHERANNLIRTNTKQSANSGYVDQLRKLRQLPE